jgi:hypothetical protein
MALDLAGRQSPCVHGHDLLVEAWKPALIFGDQLRLERRAAVARNLDLELGRIGRNSLAAEAVAVIAGFVILLEMMIEFRIQSAFGQTLLQLIDQAVLGKQSLRIVSSEQLIQK